MSAGNNIVQTGFEQLSIATSQQIAVYYIHVKFLIVYCLNSNALIL